MLHWGSFSGAVSSGTIASLSLRPTLGSYEVVQVGVLLQYTSRQYLGGGNTTEFVCRKVRIGALWPLGRDDGLVGFTLLLWLEKRLFAAFCKARRRGRALSSPRRT